MGYRLSFEESKTGSDLFTAEYTEEHREQHISSGKIKTGNTETKFPKHILPQRISMGLIENPKIDQPQGLCESAQRAAEEKHSRWIQQIPSGKTPNMKPAHHGGHGGTRRNPFIPVQTQTPETIPETLKTKLTAVGAEVSPRTQRKPKSKASQPVTYEQNNDAFCSLAFIYSIHALAILAWNIYYAEKIINIFFQCHGFSRVKACLIR